jgi:hypothetical protein
MLRIVAVTLTVAGAVVAAAATLLFHRLPVRSYSERDMMYPWYAALLDGALIIFVVSIMALLGLTLTLRVARRDRAMWILIASNVLLLFILQRFGTSVRE